MVRQFEQQRNQNMSLILDLWHPHRPSSDQLDNVELAVSFAATVVADLCRRGSGQLFVGVADPSLGRVRGPASKIILQEVMELLAGATAVGMGTALFVDPRSPVRVLSGLARWVERQKCRSITELVGRVER